MSPKIVGGACLCGTVRFELELPTAFCAHCHCTICRRAHGAAVVTWVGARRAGFRVRSGADALVRYASSDHGTRSFCGRCGSQLLCESTRQPDLVDVTLASLDGPIDRTPQLHAFYDTHVDWLGLGDALPRTDDDAS